MTYNAIFMALLPRILSALCGLMFVWIAIDKFDEAKQSSCEEYTYDNIAIGAILLFTGIVCILIAIFT